MEHAFDTVDDKVAETEFFLRKMVEAGTDMFAFNCYVSAFLSASRTCTLALQQFKDLPGFAAWYEPQRERLRVNELSKFLLDARNDHVHGGPHPISGARFHLGKAEYRFSPSRVARHELYEDAVAICRDHFRVLLEIVFDCYVQLGVHIDPQQHYSREYFSSLGRSIDDAELEVRGFVCESLIEEGTNEDGRWHELRSYVGECKINHLFFSYLGKSTPEPIMPEEYYDFEYTPEEKGWVHPPAGFNSPDDYQRYVAGRKGSAS